MPVSRSHNNGPKCSENSEYGPHNRGHKRPRSQLSNGPSVTRNHVASPPGWENQARPGSWPPLYLGGGSAMGAGPTISIPDSRFGYSSPRPPTRYSQTCSPPGLVLSLSPGLGTLSDGVPSPGAAFYRPASRTSPHYRPASRTSPPARHTTSSPCNDLLMAMTNSQDLTSLGASILSPILRNSDTESIKSESDSPATKRRRLSVSSQEVLEQLVHRSSPIPLASPRDRNIGGHALFRGAGSHPSSPHQPHYQNSGPYTRRQRNLSNRWYDRQPLTPRSNHHRRSPPLTRRSHRNQRDRNHDHRDRNHDRGGRNIQDSGQRTSLSVVALV